MVLGSVIPQRGMMELSTILLYLCTNRPLILPNHSKPWNGLEWCKSWRSVCIEILQMFKNTAVDKNVNVNYVLLRYVDSKLNSIIIDLVKSIEEIILDFVHITFVF